MFPQFGATAESLSKASSLVFRIGTDAHLYDDPDDVSIAPLLDSSFDSEKAEALKRLLALIAQGEDVSNFFPQVVKNVATPSSEVKKLVYLYILHYAEKRPNEALLSINCFQKDLSDANPLVRAWALRAMSGIRLHAIGPIALVALSKCAKDPSSYVRKCAANALSKLNDLHQEENASSLEELVSILLNDHSPGVVGAAAAAFNSICPNNLSLVGRIFRRLCETVPDVDEWGQIALINILLRYVIARHGLVEESIMASSHPSENSDSRRELFSIPAPDRGSILVEVEPSEHIMRELMLRHYIEGPEQYSSRQIDAKEDDNGSNNNSYFTSIENNDVKLLLQCTSPLLWSQNSAVVLAAAGVHWVLASQMDMENIVKPILFVLRSSYASRYVVLRNIQIFAKAMPSLFSAYHEDFFVSSSDSYQMKVLKLDILSTIAAESSIPFILQEFQDYIKDPDRRFAVDVVAAIALCVKNLPSVAKTCLEGLLAIVKQESSIKHYGSLEGEAGVLIQAIMSIKTIIKQDPANYEKVIVHLIRSLDNIKEPSARALIIWIVGEYSDVGHIILKIIPVVVSYLGQCFSSEELEAKHQILNTVAKIVLSAQGEEHELFRKVLFYILDLAKVDLNYDIRDRGRMIEKLVTSQPKISHQEGILHVEPDSILLDELLKNMFCGKIQSVTGAINHFRLYLPGSLSQIVLHAAPGYTPLPQPCSLPEMALENRMSQDGIEAANSSDSSYEGSQSSYYDSEGSIPSPVDGENPDSGSESDVADNDHYMLRGANGSPDATAIGQLIHLTDTSIHDGTAKQSTAENNTSSATDLTNLMSKSALESWLNEQPCLPSVNSSADPSRERSSARISINEIEVSVKPKLNVLLEPANGNGLRVGYSFTSEISKISPCYYPSKVPTIVPMEEIDSLHPGDMARSILQVHFHHHLLPLKLAIYYNEKRHPVKLQPDIGYFTRPIAMDLNAFTKLENHLRGMFEYSRRCTFADHINIVDQEKGQSSLNDDKILLICRKIAAKMLSSASIHLVSVDMPILLKFDEVSDLCLRFSSEILSNSKPCLITVTAEGKCSEALDISVKVNCEETVFGLNLLNRIVAFLSSNSVS
ncbi:unnamed protein product [Spirodela intermedia]|uniref:AP-3 complex subunit beta n=1 Tax=Spirodela intermedia TaxID=51605 RepID=A0A7I8IB54_SPIIN|nr:unnamed protein product [Spirodela intermedia]CAA6654987.1 unnamed protein product [Spirodela intermedia]